MELVWGVVMLLVGLVGWLGQTLSALSYGTAARLGLAEPQSDVDPVFHADVRGEAAWDAIAI